MQSLTSQIFGVVGPLGENLDSVSLWGFDIQTNCDHKSYSVRALKRHLNEKNLIHGKVMAMISKFSLQMFETYFRSTSFQAVLFPVKMYRGAHDRHMSMTKIYGKRNNIFSFGP